MDLDWFVLASRDAGSPKGTSSQFPLVELRDDPHSSTILVLRRRHASPLPREDHHTRLYSTIQYTGTVQLLPVVLSFFALYTGAMYEVGSAGDHPVKTLVDTSVGKTSYNLTR